MVAENPMFAAMMSASTGSGGDSRRGRGCRIRGFAASMDSNRSSSSSSSSGISSASTSSISTDSVCSSLNDSFSSLDDFGGSNNSSSFSNSSIGARSSRMMMTTMDSIGGVGTRDCLADTDGDELVRMGPTTIRAGGGGQLLMMMDGIKELDDVCCDDGDGTQQETGTRRAAAADQGHGGHKSASMTAAEREYANAAEECESRRKSAMRLPVRSCGRTGMFGLLSRKLVNTANANFHCCQRQQQPQQIQSVRNFHSDAFQAMAATSASTDDSDQQRPTSYLKRERRQHQQSSCYIDRLLMLRRKRSCTNAPGAQFRQSLPTIGDDHGREQEEEESYEEEEKNRRQRKELNIY